VAQADRRRDSGRDWKPTRIIHDLFRRSLEGNILSALMYSVRKVASVVHKSFSVSTEYGLKLLMFELVSPMVLIVLLISASVVLAGRHHKSKASGV
jgi:hypothetical protein